jgi:hypothetical protein
LRKGRIHLTRAREARGMPYGSPFRR